MSDKTRHRIAELQHKRRQLASQEAMFETSDGFGDPRHEPVEAGVSLRLQTELYAQLKNMRERCELRKSEFPDVDSAISATQEQFERLGSEAVFEVYRGASGSGFFKGPISGALIAVCLRSGHEGFAAVLPNLEAGVLLDVVFDDPLRGNFYEVEWWGTGK
jgi:hypothetical protein